MTKKSHQTLPTARRLAWSMGSVFTLSMGMLAFEVAFCVLPAEGAQVNGNRADLTWMAASGPVAGYSVFVERNGVPASGPEYTVSDNSFSVFASFGDVLVVRVAGLDAAGQQGPLSEASDSIEFVTAPPPPTEEPPPAEEPPAEEPPPVEKPPSTEEPPPVEYLGPPPAASYFEDFEGYRDAEDPEGWFDTGRRNSLSDAPEVFETFTLTDGTTAFGTASTETNVHSHLLIAGSSDWSAYELSGAMSKAESDGGVGVTLYSDYPYSDSYYRLRYSTSTVGGFHLAAHPDGAVVCEGSMATGVVPEPGAWYRFRFRAEPEGDVTRLRARVWEKGAGEPDAWQIDCLDPAGTFQAGAPGVWAKGPGIKLWDEIAVVPLEAAASELPIEEPAPEGDDPSPGELLYSESFESHRDGEDPEGWLDTGRYNALFEAPQVFETFALTDGTVAFGTASKHGNVHSHLLIPGSSDWSAYELSGAMSRANRRGGVGVTLYSDYPYSDSYYRMRYSTGTAGGFHLAAHPDGAVSCQGATATGVVPKPGVWYRFRFRAEPEGDATWLRARVWEKGASEPDSWQIDCLDPAGTLQAGAPGVWAKGRGIKLWDDLEVRSLGN